MNRNNTDFLFRALFIPLLLNLFYVVRSPPSEINNQYAATLAELPLPCSRYLWTANTKAEWEEATKQIAKRAVPSTGQTIAGRCPLTYGDLLQYASGTEREDEIAEWLGSMDEFGTLVMSATTLPQRD